MEAGYLAEEFMTRRQIWYSPLAEELEGNIGYQYNVLAFCTVAWKSVEGGYACISIMNLRCTHLYSPETGR
jgi:hypothetical protein